MLLLPGVLPQGRRQRPPPASGEAAGKVKSVFSLSKNFFDKKKSALWALFSSELLEQGGKALAEVVPGGVEVAGVPGVGDLLPLAAAVVEQERQLPLRVAAAQSAYVAEVRAVHADYEVVLVILRASHAVRRVPGAAYAVLGQLPARRRIDRAANLVRMRRRGADKKLLRPPGPLNHILKHKLRHRRPANIAVADEQNFCHLFHVPSKAYKTLYYGIFEA